MWLHQNRFDVWIYRRPVIKADQVFWRGPNGHIKKEWSRSLNTKVYAEAVDRHAAAHAAYKAEREAQLCRYLEDMAARSVATADAPREPLRLAQDDPDYLAAQEAAQLAEIMEDEWAQENDPLWPQREALREEVARLRDARMAQEFIREERAASAAKNAVGFMDLFADWAKGNNRPDTVTAYRRYAQDFQDHVGKSDANAITRDDVLSWRNKLRVDGGLSGKAIGNNTINNSYMAAVSTVFGHAVGETGRLKANPTADLRALRADKKPKLRERSIRDDEALAILGAAMEPGGERLTAHRRLARRWCPWIMAYTGARVSEVSQLRKEDFGEAQGVPYVFITPDAGFVKTEAARKVPLHPHLLQQGLLAMLKAQPDGPLFYDPDLGRGGRAGSQKKKVNQYLCAIVRDLGIDVPQPNHGWRHRMETMNSRYDLRDKEVRWVLGHAAKDSNGKYGDHELPNMLREIEKIPAYQGDRLPPFVQP